MSLAWICDACNGAVVDGAGWIAVDLAEVARAEERLAVWEADHPGPAITGAALLDYPDEVPWHVYHRGCDPDPEGVSYFFDVERCRSLADLADWWLHLSGKRWLRRTGWATFVRSRVMPQLAAVDIAGEAT